MLIGGNHKEWPEEDYFKQYHGGDSYDNDYDDLREEKWEMERNQGYDDWLWEQVLKDGPPQDDETIKWIKARVFNMTADALRTTIKTGESESLSPLAEVLYEHIMRT